MTVPLPANVATGLVTGRFLIVTPDGDDADREPEGPPAGGTITFVASVTHLQDPTATPAPTTMLTVPIEAILDEDGYLCSPDPDDAGMPGERGIRLPATDDPDIMVTDWTWQVVYNFTQVTGITPTIPTHSMALPSSATVDLTTVAPVPSSEGIGLVQAETNAALAMTAAREAKEAAELAAQAAQATDDGVSTLVTMGDKTTAAITALVRERIDVVDVRDYGVKGDGTTDDTAGLQAAINAAIAAGGGVVRLPTGATLLIAGTITISGTDSINLTIDGNDALLLCPENTGADVFHIHNPAYETATAMPTRLRRILIRNLKIQADPNWNLFLQRKRRAFTIEAVQDLTMSNVWISGFRYGAIHLWDVYDCVFENVQALYCGWANHPDVDAADTTPRYAIILTGKFDNTNATHWNALHLEHAPLGISIDHRSRHNHFVNSKYEQGGHGFGKNYTTQSPVYVAGLENSFANIHFTQNWQNPAGVTGPRFLTISPTEDYTSTQILRNGPKPMTSFVGCAFTTPADTQTGWLTGSWARFTDCTFQRGMGNNANPVFLLGSFVTITQCQITLAAGSSAPFSMSGQRNAIRDVEVWHGDSGGDGAEYAIGASATANVVENVTSYGGIPRMLANAISGSTLGTNRIIPSPSTTDLTALGGIAAFNAHALRYVGTTSGTITALNHGYYGQTVLLINGSSSNMLLQSNSTIKPKSGADTLMAPGALVRLFNDNGIWREA